MARFRLSLGLGLTLVVSTCVAPAFAQVATLPRVNTPTTPASAGISAVGTVLVDQAGAEKGTVANPIVTTGGGGSAGVAQGSSTAGQTGPLDQCAVVTGDQAFNVGTTNPLTCTATGRLKVGTSYSTNIAPAVIPTTTLNSALVGCQYRQTPATWQDLWTGSLRCDANGRLAAVLEQPLPAGTNTLGTVNLGTIAGAATSALQSTISGQLPGSLGQKTMANSLAVTLASDGAYATSALQTAGNGSLSTIAGTVAATGSPTTNAQTVQAASGGLQVAGNVAKGGTPAGGPVRIGCRYDGTLTAVTTGQVTECQSDQYGQTRVVIAGAGDNGAGANLGPYSADTTSQFSNGLVTQALLRGYDPVTANAMRVRNDANGLWTTVRGTASLATSQVSVGTAATLVSAARAGRSRLMITQNGAGPCYYGATSAVSATTGARLKVDGASKTYQYAGALYGICPGGAVTTDVDEEY